MSVQPICSCVYMEQLELQSRVISVTTCSSRCPSWHALPGQHRQEVAARILQGLEDELGKTIQHQHYHWPRRKLTCSFASISKCTGALEAPALVDRWKLGTLVLGMLAADLYHGQQSCLPQRRIASACGCVLTWPCTFES